jgi:alkanesulfonate monooxygenase SsuD/methylene tetrahydromethanopterin reductase-like flavin-dependent oxidoreductase (luciferase family)
VWLGSLPMKALDAVIDYCDGWYPVGAEYEALARRVKVLRETADRAGRQFAKIDLAVALLTPDGEKM